MSKEELKEMIDSLQKEFDYLWDNHLYPLKMRYIGCRIIALKEELLKYEETTSTNDDKSGDLQQDIK